MSTISPIRRPRYSPRGILHVVQQVANEIAQENAGKVPDVFLIDARLRQRFDATPELYDRDKMVRDARKYWERSNNQLISHKTGSIFVPGAYVTLGKKTRGRMDGLDPYVDLRAWMQTDEEIVKHFTRTMDRRREYQLHRLQEAAINPDCKTLGELEARLHGYVPAPGDDMPFSEDDDDGDAE